jgi:hypothetical protein
MLAQINTKLHDSIKATQNSAMKTNINYCTDLFTSHSILHNTVYSLTLLIIYYLFNL